MTSAAHCFFIVGVQRSGSTLLRLILNAHPRIAVPEEARFLVPLLNSRYMHGRLSGERLRRVESYIVQHPQFALWNYDPSAFTSWLTACNDTDLAELIDRLYASFRDVEGKQVWGDKSLFFHRIPALHRLFPDARFIHIVRDGRDVFHSWRRIDDTKSKPAVIGLDWRHKIRVIEQALDAIPTSHHATIRYEDLVRAPDATLTRVCALLGIDFDPAMLDFHQTSHFYIGKHHSQLIFAPVDGSNAEKWRRTLNPREQRAFTGVAGSTLRRYDYDAGERPGLRGALDIAAQLAVGLPLRGLQVLQTKLTTEKAARTGQTPTVTVGDMPTGRRDGPESSDQ